MESFMSKEIQESANLIIPLIQEYIIWYALIYIYFIIESYFLRVKNKELSNLFFTFSFMLLFVGIMAYTNMNIIAHIFALVALFATTFSPLIKYSLMDRTIVLIGTKIARN